MRRFISWDFIAGLSLAVVFSSCHRTPAVDMPNKQFKNDYRNVILRADPVPGKPIPPVEMKRDYGIVWA